MARNGSVFKSITNKNLAVSEGKQKKCVIRQGLFFHLAKNSRDLEPKMRKVGDVKYDTFGRIGRNLIPISYFISQRELSKIIRNAIKSSSATDQSLFVQDVQHPWKSKPTWGNKLRKKGKKNRDKKMNLARFSKSFCRKTSKKCQTTTENLTAIERSLLLQLVLT